MAINIVKEHEKNLKDKILSDLQEKWLIAKLGENNGRKKLRLLHTYQEVWELHKIELAQSISHNNLIFYAVSEKYGDVIFKILLNNGFDKEISAIRSFQGSKFVSLYEYSLTDEVYLMEKITPGTTLFEGTTRNKRIEIVSDIFNELHPAPPANHVFPTYFEWFKSGEIGTRNRKDCDMFRSYLEKAEKTILHINENYPRRLLLHGDLHHENILKNGAGEYKVIDPKGVVGNSVFDLSRFILDEFRDDLTSEPKSAVIDFVKSVGNGVKIPCDTLLQCLFVETVIWLFREELSQGASLQECEGLIANMKIANELQY